MFLKIADVKRHSNGASTYDWMWVRVRSARTKPSSVKGAFLACICVVDLSEIAIYASAEP